VYCILYLENKDPFENISLDKKDRPIQSLNEIWDKNFENFLMNEIPLQSMGEKKILNINNFNYKETLNKVENIVKGIRNESSMRRKLKHVFNSPYYNIISDPFS
jgi:hypothetical protein